MFLQIAFTPPVLSLTRYHPPDCLVSSVQLLSRAGLFATPWTAALQCRILNLPWFFPLPPNYNYWYHHSFSYLNETQRIIMDSFTFFTHLKLIPAFRLFFFFASWSNAWISLPNLLLQQPCGAQFNGTCSESKVTSMNSLILTFCLATNYYPIYLVT